MKKKVLVVCLLFAYFSAFSYSTVHHSVRAVTVSPPQVAVPLSDRPNPALTHVGCAYAPKSALQNLYAKPSATNNRFKIYASSAAIKKSSNATQVGMSSASGYSAFASNSNQNGASTVVTGSTMALTMGNSKFNFPSRHSSSHTHKRYAPGTVEDSWGSWLEDYYDWRAENDGGSSEDYEGDFSKFDEWYDFMIGNNGTLPFTYDEFRNRFLPLTDCLWFMLLLSVLYIFRNKLIFFKNKLIFKQKKR